MTLSPLPKKVTDEIRHILEGIKSGRLEHVQGEFHCGSAHCVAGWYVVLNAQKLGLVYIPEDETFEPSDPEADTDPDCWDIARENWGLTPAESAILFLWNAALDIQFALLEYLESGQRVWTKHANYMYCYTDEGVGLALLDTDENTRIDSPFLQFLEKRKAKEQS